MSPNLEGVVLLLASVAIFALFVVLPWAVVWLITGPVETAWDRYEQYDWQFTQRSDRRPARRSGRTKDHAPSTPSQRSGTAAPDEGESSVRIPRPTRGEKE